MTGTQTSPSSTLPGSTGGQRGMVLIVEDEKSIADVVSMYLVRAGYGVQHESDGDAGFAAIKRLRPAAVILDIALPGMDGVEICRRMRADDDWTPVLFMTARDEEVDRIVGLELGADDYVTKPFSPREMVARVASVLRRTQGVPSSSTLEVGQVRVDLEGHRVYAANREVALTATEFDLLSYLMKKPGRVHTREQLLSEVWGYAPTAGTRTVDVHVAQLRSKLGEASPVRTVRGVGYAAEDRGDERVTDDGDVTVGVTT